MQIITKRDVIRSVRDRFFKQYAHYPDDREIGSGTNRKPVGDIRAALSSLDLETATQADVADVLVGSGWVTLECDECGQDQERVMRIGETPDYEARWQDLCSRCLAIATAKLVRSQDAA